LMRPAGSSTRYVIDGCAGCIHHTKSPLHLHITTPIHQPTNQPTKQTNKHRCRPCPPAATSRSATPRPP
jgi:hypothetical protein